MCSLISTLVHRAYSVVGIDKREQESKKKGTHETTLSIKKKRQR